MQDTEATEPRETALETQWGMTSASVDPADDPCRRIMQRRRETIRDAEAQVPRSWRRRLDPAGGGLTWSELRWHPAARDRLAGRVQRTPARSRPRGAMRQSRPRARRTSSSSRTSSCDPGDHDSSEPPRLTLWRHPRFGSATPNLLRLLVREQAAEAQR